MHSKMNRLLRLALTAFVGLCIPTQSRAGMSAVVVIYQPIITQGEGDVIITPKGFLIMAIPFDCFHYHGHPAYYAIGQPNPVLTDMPRPESTGDSNLLSLARVRVDSSVAGDVVSVHLESLKLPAFPKLAEDDVAEATLECIRRMSKDADEHPTVKIIGKSGEDAKWRRWQDHYGKHDLSKPYFRPGA